MGSSICTSIAPTELKPCESSGLRRVLVSRHRLVALMLLAIEAHHHGGAAVHVRNATHMNLTIVVVYLTVVSHARLGDPWDFQLWWRRRLFIKRVRDRRDRITPCICSASGATGMSCISPIPSDSSTDKSNVVQANIFNACLVDELRSHEGRAMF